MKSIFLKIKQVTSGKINSNHIDSKSGFTIVEVMIYFAMTSLILTFLVLMSMNLMDSREKINAHHEVGINGRYIMEVISREISNAAEIVLPDLDNEDKTVLSLRQTGDDPEEPETVVFLLTNNNLYFNSSANSSNFKLNSSLVNVKSVEFERINDYQVTISLLLEYSGYNNIGSSVEENFRTSVNNNLFANAPLSSDKDIISFTVNENGMTHTGIINSVNNTIDFTIVPGSYEVTIVTNGVSVSPKSGAAVTLYNGQEFRVTAEDGSTKSYTITLKSGTAVPFI